MDSESISRSSTSSGTQRSDTPYSRQKSKSVDTQSGRLPEMVIKCQRCNEYLYVHLWPHHRSLHKALDLFGYTEKGQLKDLTELTERRLRLLGKPIPIKSKANTTSSKQTVVSPPHPSPQPSPQKAVLVDQMFDILRLGLIEEYQVLLMQKVSASIPIMDDRIVISIPTSIPFISGLAVASTDPEFESKLHQRPHLVDYPSAECFASASIPFVQDYFGGHYQIERRPLDVNESPDYAKLKSQDENEQSKYGAFPNPFSDSRSPPTVSVFTSESLFLGAFDALGGPAAARCISRELPFRFLVGLNADEHQNGTDTCSCVLNMFDTRPSTEDPAGRLATAYSAISTPRLESPDYSFSDDLGVGTQTRLGVFEDENHPSPLQLYLNARRPTRHACSRLVELANNVLLPQLRSGGSLWHVCGDELDARAESHAERAAREEKRAPEASSGSSSSARGETAAKDWARVKDAFGRAFHYADFMSSRGESERARSTWSACSLACAYIRTRSPAYHWTQMRERVKSSEPPSKNERTAIGDLFIANTGATRVLLIRGDKAIELTKAHLVLPDADLPASLEKQLALSRALGLHGAPELKRSVSATPHQTRVTLDEHCAVLVLASEALFRAFEPDHVGALIHEILFDLQEQMKQFVRKLNIRREREKQLKLRAEKKALKAAEEAARPVSSKSESTSALSSGSRATSSSTDTREARRRRNRRHRRRHRRDAGDSQSASISASRTSSSYSRASGSSDQRSDATSRTGDEDDSDSGSSGSSSDEEDPEQVARDELGLESMLSEYDEIDKVPPARLRQEIARHLADRLYCAARMTGSWGPLSVVVALLPAIEYYLKNF